MSAALALDRILEAWRPAIPPEVPPEYVDSFITRLRPRLLALVADHLAAQAPACEAREVSRPSSHDPNDLKARVLEVVHRRLATRNADMRALAEAVAQEGIEVTADLLRTWLFHDPYIRFGYQDGEFSVVPPTPAGGPPPAWVVRRTLQIEGKAREVLTCMNCAALVMPGEDPWTIRHRDLCPSGPVQFAAHKLPRVEKLLVDLNARARRLGVGGGLSLRVVREFLYSTHVGTHHRNDPGWDCDPLSRPEHWEDLPYVEIAVEGEVPKIPGWKVLGVLQHATEEGEDWTILRDAPGRSIPARYRSAGPDCEHCRQPRRRKETVILEDERGRVMQVGRTCLADYTGSSDAEARIKAFLSWQEMWARVRELTEDTGVDEQWALDPVTRVIELERYLGWVARCVREFGFVSAAAAEANIDLESTGRCAASADSDAKHAARDSTREVPRPSAEDQAQAREALAWARENLTPEKAQSNFEHNLGVIVRRGYVDPQTIATAPWIFQKWRRARYPEAFQVRGKDEHRPEEVGEKVKLRLTVKRVIADAALTNYGYSDLYIFADEESRELKLFTTAADGPEEGDVVELTAEIRRKDEYRGRRQTVIAKRSRGWTIVHKAIPRLTDDSTDKDDEGDAAEALSPQPPAPAAPRTEATPPPDPPHASPPEPPAQPPPLSQPATPERPRRPRPQPSSVDRPLSPPTPTGDAAPFLALPDVRSAGALAATLDGRSLGAAVRQVRRSVPKGSPAWILADGQALFLVAFSAPPDGSATGEARRWFIARVAAEVTASGVFVGAVDDLEGLVGIKGAVELEQQDGRLAVRASGRRFALRSLAGVQLPELPTIRPQRVWPSRSLRDGFSAVLFSASRDTARISLNAVLIDPRGASVGFVTTDGHRLTLCEVELPALEGPILFPLVAAEFVPQLLKDDGLVRVGTDAAEGEGGRARWIGLAGEGPGFVWTWIVESTQAVFPPYEKVIPSPGEVTCTVDGSETARALALLVPFAGSMKTAASLWSLTESELVIRYGDAESETEAAVSVPLACVLPKSRTGEARVTLSPRYLLETFEAWPFHERVRLSLQPGKNGKDADDPIRLDAEGAGWRAVAIVMHMRGSAADSTLRPSAGACGPAPARTRSLSEPLDWAGLSRTELNAEVVGELLAVAASRVSAVAKYQQAHYTTPPPVAVIADKGRLVFTLPALGLGLRVDMPARVTARGVALTDADALVRAAAVLKDQTCVVASLRDRSLTLRAGGAVFRVGGVFDAEGDYNHKLGKPRATLPARLAQLALKSALEVTGEDDDRHPLGHLRCAPTPGGVSFAASDNAMLLRVEVEGPWDMPAFSLDEGTAKLAATALDGATELGVAGDPERVRLFGLGGPVEWAVIAQSTQDRNGGFDDVLKRESGPADFRCTLRTAELRGVLTSMRRAVEAEQRRLAPQRQRGREKPDVYVLARFDAGGMTLSIHGAADGQQWHVPMDCASDAQGVSIGLDPSRLRTLLGLRLFADQVASIELFHEPTRPFRVTVAGDGWRATGLLAPVRLERPPSAQSGQHARKEGA